MTTTDPRMPLAWVPFSVADLGGPVAGVEIQEFRSDRDRPPANIAEVEFYVPSYTMQVDEGPLLTAMSRLRVVQTLTAGVNHIRSKIPDGVTLCNARGLHDTSTAEMALTLMLSSLRAIPGFVHDQDAHRWAAGWHPALADKTVLIVGYGSIGSAIEQRLLPFEVDVVRVARSARPGATPPVHGTDSLASLLPDADVVVLVAPLTDETLHLADAAFFAAMKEGALLVNVGRGGLVDTEALVDAGASGRISAALDVTDPEPLPADHPLWSTPGVLITPHVSGLTSAMWPRAHRLVRAQLERFAAGEPVANQLTGEY